MRFTFLDGAVPLDGAKETPSGGVRGSSVIVAGTPMFSLSAEELPLVELGVLLYSFKRS